MDIASIGEAAGDDEFTDCFDERMVEILRHMSHVFFECFPEVNCFSLDQLEEFGKSLIKLSSGKRATVNQVLSDISAINVARYESSDKKKQITAACDVAITQLMKGPEGVPVPLLSQPLLNRAFEYLQACRDRANLDSDYSGPQFASGLSISSG